MDVLVSHTGLCGRAILTWGASFRPVHMAKQESEERGAADKLQYTHTQVIVDDHTRTIVVLKSQRQPAAEKVQKPMKECCPLTRVSLVTLCVYLVRDEDLLCCR